FMERIWSSSLRSRPCERREGVLLDQVIPIIHRPRVANHGAKTCIDDIADAFQSQATLLEQIRAKRLQQGRGELGESHILELRKNVALKMIFVIALESGAHKGRLLSLDPNPIIFADRLWRCRFRP